MADTANDCFKNHRGLGWAYKTFYVVYGNTEFVPVDALVPCADATSGASYKKHLALKGFVHCVEYLKSKILDVEQDLMLVNRLQDGCVRRICRTDRLTDGSRLCPAR
ncbi:GL19947 [Drosophila persimilis]|uniref:GL19947 n=1 Tax=Drosophila persimilis TaxID=7234 RepID=B4GYL2_DROPE|nr:GL19947 [Drosophila persimilis]